MYQEIRYAVEGASALIHLHRPERLNALTRRMLAELRHAIAAAENDARVVGIILTGSGRGFSAGMDTAALAQAAATGKTGGGETFDTLAAEPGSDLGPAFRVTFAYLLRVGKPIIAAINGPCAGLSFVIACLCDLRFASEDAIFKLSFAQRGLVGEHGVAWILPRLVGPSRALDLMWHPRKITAEEALALGLVNRRVAAGAVVDSARTYIEALASESSPASLREMKQQVYRGLMQPLDVAMTEALTRMEASFHRPDFAEGVQSFLDQRSPRFPRLGQ